MKGMKFILSGKYSSTENNFHKYDFRLSKILITFIFCIVVAGISLAQEPLGTEERDSLILKITENFPEWETIEISGKLKMNGLPLSPSVKISMEKDSSIFISLRAPFLGEVGRAEVTKDSLLIVNKMKKVYVAEPLEDLMRNYPAGIVDLQNLILGVPVFPGYGPLDIEISDAIDIYKNEEGTFLLPSDYAALEMADYGYGINENFLLSELLIIYGEDSPVNIDINYIYDRNKYQMNFLYISETRSIEAALELDYPIYKASPMEPMKIGKGYYRVSFADFMKSF